jgi:exonuclease SbcC
VRPQRLEFEGFTAFRDRQEIDFSEFSLFTITGPTGAGKTSILDAMIFALFGSVPRAGAQGVRDLVSQGLAEARVAFRFSIGTDSYRIARRLPRKGAQSATFERLEGEDWSSEIDGGGVRAANRRIIEVLKLDFDAFTRAVVLPQGQFQRFLTGDPNDRRKILVELLGLKSYERMAALARSRAGNLKAGTDSTQSVLDTQYADARETQLALLKEAATTASERSQQLANVLTRAEAMESQRAGTSNALARLETLGDSLGAFTGELTELRDGLATALAEEQQLHESFEQAAAQLEASEARCATAQTALTELAQAHGDLASIARIEGALESISDCTAQREEHTQSLDTAEAQLEKATETEGRDAALAAEATDALHKAEAATADANGAADPSKTRAAELAQKTVDANNAHAEREKAAAAAQSAAERLTEVEAAVGSTRADLSAAEQLRAATENENHVAALVVDLEPGDPCPVCKRPLKEHPTTEPGAATLLKEAREREELSRKAVQHASDQRAAAEEGLSLAKRHLSEWTERLSVALGGHDDVGSLQAAAASAAADAAQAVRGLEGATTAERIARTQEQAVGKQAIESAEACKRWKERVADAKQSIVRIDNQLGSHRSTVAAHFHGAPPDDPAATVTEQRAALESAGAALADAHGLLQDARIARDTSDTQLRTCQQTLSEITARLRAVRDRCTGIRDQSGEPLALVGQEPPADVPSVVEDHGEHLDELHGWCKTALGGIEAGQTKGAQALADSGDTLTALLTECAVEQADEEPVALLRSAARRADERKGQASAQVTEMERRINGRQQLEAGIAEQRVQAQVLSTLGTELRADHFIDFVLHETLELLAVRASEELLRISEDRYELSTKEGDFCVIDHVNADETRGVNTLSGGETFLASLSLALALSQHIGDLATEGMGAKLEAVFIDEGFGSLDPETLDDVINALERLREANLIIGVITHVSTMADRISVGLIVETNAGRSQIRVVNVA